MRIYRTFSIIQRPLKFSLLGNISSEKERDKSNFTSIFYASVALFCLIFHAAATNFNVHAQ